MALETFYGGKPGFSPVIKGKFKYLNKEDLAYQADLAKANQSADTLKQYTMDECFSDPNYTDIWYNELCIIDADNKSNPNNGKIFRRTLKKINDDAWLEAGNTLYAEYIGKIVGPAGGIPKLHLGGLDEERKRAAGKLPTYDNEGNNLNTNNWEYIYPNSEGKIASANPGDNYSVIAELSASTNSNDNRIEMVPGGILKADGTWDENGYHDTIKYTWCNVHRNLDGSDEDYWIYLGFQIPYTVFNINAQDESYNYSGPVFINNSDTNHPFTKDFTFHLPKGVRGIGPEEVFVINPNDPDNSRTIPTGATLYNYDAISYNQNTDKYSIDLTKTKTVTIEDSYWVGKWCIYNSGVNFTNTPNVDVFYLYLGAYKDASSLTTGNADIHIIGPKPEGYNYIYDRDTTVSENGQLYITDKNENAEIYFIDTRLINGIASSATSVEPSGYKNIVEILGADLLAIKQ